LPFWSLSLSDWSLVDVTTSLKFFILNFVGDHSYSQTTKSSLPTFINKFSSID